MTNLFTRLIGKIIAIIEKPLVPVIKFINYVGVMTIMLISVFIVIDVVLRTALNSPITGGYELVQYAMIIVVFLALAYTQHVKGNVSVELLTEHFPMRVQAILSMLVNIVCTVFWGAVTYAGVLQAVAQYNKHVVSATLRIPVYPVVIILIIGTALYTIVSFVDVLKDLQMVCSPSAYLESLKAVSQSDETA